MNFATFIFSFLNNFVVNQSDRVGASKSGKYVKWGFKLIMLKTRVLQHRLCALDNFSRVISQNKIDLERVATIAA
jgi:hypothetical protein